jgi:uncharacterized protein (TIGR00369 family)
MVSIGGTSMKNLNPEYVRTISSITNNCPYFELLSMSILELEMGSSLLEIDLGNKHLQPFGMVHGGVFASIIDAACFWAIFLEAAEGDGMTTVDLKLNYLAPAGAVGKLVARRIKLGKTLGLADATITDQDGKMLAHGTSTLMVIPNMDFGSGDGLPPKFLES